MADADAVVYVVSTPERGEKYPKYMKAAVTRTSKDGRPMVHVAFVETLDLAKQISAFLTDSSLLNHRLGIEPKCGEPCCDHQRLFFGINIIATPCSDCGNIPGIRGNERIQAHLEKKGIGLAQFLKEPPFRPKGEVHKYGVATPIKDEFLPLDMPVSWAAIKEQRDRDTTWHVEEIIGREGVRVQQEFVGHPAQPQAVHYMNQDAVMKHVKSLAGRILTVIDASFPEGSQRTAFKSLIKREVRTQLGRILSFFMLPNCDQSHNDGEAEVTQSLDE